MYGLMKWGNNKALINGSTETLCKGMYCDRYKRRNLTNTLLP